MKKILFIALATIITSCSSSHVCGGSSGKRCVERTNQSNFQNFS